MFNKVEKERLLKLLGKIKDKTVIVEGARDKKILYSLGFTKIITVRHGPYGTATKIKDKEVCILTDFDRAGEELAKKLNLFLQSYGCKVDRFTRRKLKFMFVKLRLTAIEDLKSLR